VSNDRGLDSAVCLYLIFAVMLTGRRLRRRRSVTLTVQSAPGGASLSALKEGKSKSEQMSIRNQI
jgi:hypothetical protein